jgi:hypothetical protein
MPHAKPCLTPKRRNKVAPVLGAAGLSVVLAGGGSAATGTPAGLMLTPNNGASHKNTLLEEAIFDVTLATFLVVNKETARTFYFSMLPTGPKPRRPEPLLRRRPQVEDQLLVWTRSAPRLAGHRNNTVRYTELTNPTAFCNSSTKSSSILNPSLFSHSSTVPISSAP